MQATVGNAREKGRWKEKHIEGKEEASLHAGAVLSEPAAAAEIKQEEEEGRAENRPRMEKEGMQTQRRKEGGLRKGPLLRRMEYVGLREKMTKGRTEETEMGKVDTKGNEEAEGRLEMGCVWGGQEKSSPKSKGVKKHRLAARILLPFCVRVTHWLV